MDIAESQAAGLDQERARLRGRPMLALWDEVGGLGGEKSRDVRGLLEEELGMSYRLSQGLSVHALGGVAIVPVLDSTDRELFALAHRIRERCEQGRAPRRLLVILMASLSGQEAALPKNQTLSWLRQSLGKALDFEVLVLGGKKVRRNQASLDKNLRPLDALSKVLLDWFSGEKRTEEALEVEEPVSLAQEVSRVLSERWGLESEPSSRAFPMDHQIQEEDSFFPLGKREKSEKCEAGRFKSPRVDVSAGTRIGGIRE